MVRLLDSEKVEMVDKSYIILVHLNFMVNFHCIQGVPKKRGISECGSVCSTCAFDINLGITITYSSENRDPYVHVNQKNISEGYQGAKT